LNDGCLILPASVPSKQFNVTGPARARELRKMILGLDALGDIGIVARLAAG
jgi:hypothetical protein